MRRKQPLATNETYHVFNRSIEKYVIFSQPRDFLRFKQLLRYYQKAETIMKFSYFIRMETVLINGFETEFEREHAGQPNIVDLLAYCVMPTHFHLILRQKVEGGIARYMSQVLNGYTRYLNTRRARSGPLWDGRFKNVHVRSDEQLKHLTRYVHLNPVTDYLAERPEDWEYSSYREYVSPDFKGAPLCTFRDQIDMKREIYKQFVADYIDNQRRYSKIKKESGQTKRTSCEPTLTLRKPSITPPGCE